MGRTQYAYPDMCILHEEHEWYVHKYVLAKHAPFFAQLFSMLPHNNRFMYWRRDVLMFDKVIRCMYGEFPVLQNTSECHDFFALLHELGARELIAQYLKEYAKPSIMSPVDAIRLYYRLCDIRYARMLLYDRFAEWVDPRVDEKTERQCIALLRTRELLQDGAQWQYNLNIRQVWTLWALWFRMHGSEAAPHDMLVAFLCDRLRNFDQVKQLKDSVHFFNFYNVFAYLTSDETTRVRTVIQHALLEVALQVDMSKKEHVQKVQSVLFGS